MSRTVKQEKRRYRLSRPVPSREGCKNLVRVHMEILEEM